MESAHTLPLDLLTIREAHEELRVSRRKLFQLIRDGELAAVKLGGRTLVEREELRRLIERNRTS
jgi:excisionase family DNA binding protein